MLSYQRRQYALTLRRKKWCHYCFRFGSCMCRSGFGEHILTVYALYIRKWSTTLQHCAMVSTCRIHWLIFVHRHLLNLCVFSQWKLRFPRENLTQFPCHYLHAASSAHVIDSTSFLFQFPIRHLFVRSRKFSKPQDLYLELYDCSEIWQTHQQQCCRCACQISERSDNFYLQMSRLRYFARAYNKTSY